MEGRDEGLREVEGVYLAHFGDVYRYALHLTQGDEALSQDLTSDCFLKAMDKMKDFRGEGELRVWLCQILKNLFLDEMRRQKRRPVAEVPEDLKAETDFVEQLIKGEDAKRAHQALHALSEPYKEVFTLRVMGGLSFQQIGELFSKTSNWACVVYHRARKKLIEGFKEEEK